MAEPISQSSVHSTCICFVNLTYYLWQIPSLTCRFQATWNVTRGFRKNPETEKSFSLLKLEMESYVSLVTAKESELDRKWKLRNQKY